MPTERFSGGFDTSWLQNSNRWSTVERYVQAWEEEDRFREEEKERNKSVYASEFVALSLEPEGEDVVIPSVPDISLPVIDRVARESPAPFYPPQPATIPISHGQTAAAK